MTTTDAAAKTKPEAADLLALMQAYAKLRRTVRQAEEATATIASAYSLPADARHPFYDVLNAANIAFVGIRNEMRALGLDVD